MYSAALRASGRSTVPMVTSIVAFVVIRQIFLAITIPMFHDISVIGYCYSFSWIVGAAMTAIYYFKSNWLKKTMENN